MQISSIQQNNNVPSFGATIVKTVPAQRFLETMGMKSNAKEATMLWNKIEEAVSRHPSEMFIFSNTYNMYGQKTAVRGVLATTTDTFTDKTIKKSPYSALWSAWKNLLNPENEVEFHKIFGEKYAPQYKEWWDANISSIWEKLSKMA